ncbi:serine hydrolase domain-containing protein [Parabacteroides bouchesdurhonensis]|uniref:serine hydrolase domain-containing protein n=1 Tax=Parabacteroides bouchesdurhonensis TaxID=1936995 RepID=UPI000E503F0A|nr:serine hydrolase [Parabacteroides bouchesdurhonensis]RHJ91127.1 class C beta-lactamase-related serine hydrolase [Bacteroides sp. AM07-16]
MKKTGWAILLVICCIGGYLALPSNYYLRRALVHLLPKIDQYPIFENRIVKAGAPEPWKISEKYNTLSIPVKYIPAFEELGTVAFIIIQNDSLLFEQYWEDYSPNSHSNSFSMAKSIVSLATGCAIDDGFIKSVDQPVSDFIPGFEGFNGKQLTLRHLLTMSAGVDFQEAYSSPFSPTTKLYYGNNLQEIAFGMKEIEEPGKRFNYQSGVTQLLAFILEKATGEPLSSYVSRKLWTPMHAEEDALWSMDRKDGIEKAYCCFNSNARDFARFGQLLLNKGSWNGQQLVSASYLEEAITPDSSLLYNDTDEPNKSYGFQFWSLNHDGIQIPYMRGILGQYVFVIPERNAVVVRLGHKRDKEYTSQHYPQDIDTWLDAAMDIIQKSDNTSNSNQTF